MVAGGCEAVVGAAAGVAETFDTDQLAGDAAGAVGVTNVGVAIAAGAEAIDEGCVAVVAPMGADDPTAVTGELVTGGAEVAGAVLVGATAPVGVAVTTEAAGGTGWLAAGCDANALDVPAALNAVPVDEVAVLIGSVETGAEGCAAIDPDVKLTGVAVAVAGVAAGAGSLAVEPTGEAEAPVIDGVTAGVTVEAGADARVNEP